MQIKIESDGTNENTEFKILQNKLEYVVSFLWESYINAHPNLSMNLVTTPASFKNVKDKNGNVYNVEYKGSPIGITTVTDKNGNVVKNLYGVRITGSVDKEIEIELEYLPNSRQEE